jgi:uncharacterized protein
MLATTARVETDRATLYLKQLCEHFADPERRHSGQQFEVSFDEREGLINLAPVVSGSCRLDASKDGVLVLSVSGADRAAVERLQRIIARHVERFGHGDGLRVAWGPISELP